MRKGLLFLCFIGNLMAFEPLSETYTVAFGQEKAPIEVVEYFSLACPECLTSINHDFPKLSKEWIETGKVRWIFHPDPADLFTLQLMVCFERLLPEEKPPFFLEVAKLAKKNPRKTTHLMFDFLEKKGRGKKSLLRSLSYLESSRATREAMDYLDQQDAPTKTPSISINGKQLDKLPTFKVVDEALRLLTKQIRE